MPTEQLLPRLTDGAITLAIAAGTYVLAAVAKKSADMVIDEAYTRLKLYVRRKLGRTHGDTLDVETLQESGIGGDAEGLDLSRQIVAHSPALRRVQLVLPVLHGSRILWVDDEPRNNSNEVELFTLFGAYVSTARSTEEAFEALAAQSYDLLLSDIARAGSPDAGLRMLERLPPSAPPVVFYVGSLNSSLGVPRGAFGIAQHPELLIHLVLDVLERRRV